MDDHDHAQGFRHVRCEESQTEEGPDSFSIDAREPPACAAGMMSDFLDRIYLSFPAVGHICTMATAMAPGLRMNALGLVRPYDFEFHPER